MQVVQMAKNKNKKNTFAELWKKEYQKGKTYKKVLTEVSGSLHQIIEKQDFTEDKLTTKINEFYGSGNWDNSFYYEIAEKYEEKAEKDRIRTNPDIVLLIQTIAKKLNPNGPFVDWAVGLGSILVGIGKNIFGQDIDPDMVRITKANLGINKLSSENIIFGDSLKNPVKKDGIIIFDPPMGGQQSKPTNWNSKEVKQILGSNTGKTPPEILFLTSFFLHSKPDSYFIGLFPESFISRNSGEFNSIRKYLIKHSLKTIIRTPKGLLLVVGFKGKNLNKDDEIPIIRMKQNFSISKFLKTQSSTTFSEFITEFTHFSKIKDQEEEERIHLVKFEKRESLLSNDNCAISLPYEITRNVDSKTVKELQILLKEAVYEIQNNYDELNTLLDVNLKIEGTKDQITESEPKEKLIDWIFTKDNITEVKNILSELLNRELIFPVLDDSVCVFDQKKIKSEFNRYYDYQDIFKQIKILYEDKRLKNVKGLLNISADKDKGYKIATLDFKKFIMPKQFFKSVMDLLNINEKQIYQNLCEYWIFGEEDKTFIRTKAVSFSDIVRSLKLFKEIGLVIKTQNQDIYEKDIIELYQTHRIYHPFIDGMVE
jgi:hypothetical protein